MQIMGKMSAYFLVGISKTPFFGANKNKVVKILQIFVIFVEQI